MPLSETLVINGSVTRPNDTTQYAAGEVVSDATSTPVGYITFTGCGAPGGGGGVILSAELIDSANQTTKGNFELWVFDVAPTAMEDNAAFDPTDAEMATVVAVIPFNGSAVYVGNAGSAAAGNAIYLADAVNRPFRSASSNLFGVVVVRNAYTPVAQEVFTFRLQVTRD